MRKRKRSRSGSTSAEPLLPCMLSCFNLKLGLDTPVAHTLSNNHVNNSGLKKGLISIKRQSDSVLGLDVGYTSKPSLDLRRLSFDSNCGSGSPSESNTISHNHNHNSSQGRIQRQRDAPFLPFVRHQHVGDHVNYMRHRGHTGDLREYR